MFYYSFSLQFFVGYFYVSIDERRKKTEHIEAPVTHLRVCQDLIIVHELIVHE